MVLPTSMVWRIEYRAFSPRDMDHDPRSSTPQAAPPRARTPGRFWLDFGPLLCFFAANKLWGILAATALLIPLSLLALFLTWKLEKRVPRAMVYGNGAVLVFGLLTLAFRDETFIKLKVTAINLILGAVLGVGLLRGRSLLKSLFGESFQLSDEGWRLLTLRFTFFFFFLAGLNEVLRRVLSTDAWVNFKVFGVLGATLVFTLLQTPLLQKHGLEEPRS